VTINGVNAAATVPGPATGNVLAIGNYEDNNGDPQPVKIYAPATSGTATPIGTGSVSMSGLTVGANTPTGATAFSIREPYLAMYYIIATNGIYPTRP
jgi:microcystin-dependent protein